MDLHFNGTTDALNCYGYPEFASNLIFELHQNDTSDSQYVRILHDGEAMKLCEKDQTTCDYSEFSARINNFQITQAVHDQ